MKSFLTTAKGKAIAGIVTLAVIAVVAIVAVISSRGYRTIAIEELNGTTRVSNNSTTEDAYVGQHLKSGDDVKVEKSSDLTLGLDSDKYVYAKENTHFWVEAQGKSDNTRTIIKLDEGSALCRIDNKLKDTEAFQIDTPNSTMSVRGTVFKTETSIDSTGDRYTCVDVFEGAVNIQVKMENGQNTSENRTIGAGERAVIRSNKNISEFVKGNDEIVYEELTQGEALFLGKVIDDGRDITISKELLYDIVEITDHDYSLKSSETEASCTEDGYYYEVCSICNAEGEKIIIQKLGHDYVEDKENGIKVCSRCGNKIEADQQEKADEVEENEVKEDEAKDKKDCTDGHTFETITVVATCTKDGYEDDVCKVCGYKTNHVVLPARGHQYQETIQAATCTADGIKYHKCKGCSDQWAEVIKATGHDFDINLFEATCTEDGKNSKVCKKCGADQSEIISALGHNKGAVAWDGTHHWYPCTRCGVQLDKSSHNLNLGSSGCADCGWR